ncbi:2-hydroxyacid dehydrogenase [Aurantimonas sp. Leaf443]|uniref:2-hydroxyacid dehydrogenase n=1 Tax=Aurantimonas sp. Leaf443 TaxID=1736378 RepID=UPI0006F5F8C1|nr:2-hydroxyacid dehydrogenase [Aurantimonas sp. Leaf443]KQT87121.1 hydroxyacid dehydrogenase [Aurantimonas sp. Leaf443]
MHKPDLLMIAPAPPAMAQALDEDFTVHRYFEAEDKAALLSALADRVRYVATGGSHGCSAEIIAALPKLELVASLGVGYDAVDVTAARAAGVRVTNTPDVLNDCVAEMTLALMLALCHRVPQADRYVREGRWASEGHFPLTDELTGRRAGILGLGRIGKEIARRLQAFRMEVVYHGRNRQEHEPYPYYADLETMARAVDWLVVVAPGSAETQGIVSRAVMEALGEKGRLVNVARGSLVDEEAMIELLAAGRLGGAALDVFAREPDVPEALRALDTVVLTPHHGSATHKTRAAMAALVVANLRAHLRGDPLKSPVA